MRRKNLLAAGMLAVLLATSACGAVTGAPDSPNKSSVPASGQTER